MNNTINEMKKELSKNIDRESVLHFSYMIGNFNIFLIKFSYFISYKFRNS